MAGPNFWGYTQRGTQSIGQRLGGDLGEILNGLAQQKAQNIKFSQNKQFLQSLGIRPDVAAPLARQSDENIFKFLNNFEGFNIGEQPQQAPLQGLVHPEVAPQSFQNQPNAPQQTVQKQPSEQKDAISLLKALNENPAIAQQLSPEQVGQLLQNQATQQALHPQVQKSVQAPKIQSKAAAEAERAARIQQLKEAHELKKHERERTEKGSDESKKFLKELNQDAKSARDNNTRLNRMEELIKTGKLTNPTFYSAINAAAEGLLGQFGPKFDLKHLQNPESQEFEKLSNDMIKGIKDIFGNRVTNLDVESFLKTIPTLGQSNAAKQRVISNLKIFNDGQIIRQKVAKDIIKENGGIVPPDLELLVDEAAGPELDILADKFKNQESTKVPGTQRLVPNIVRSVGNLFVG